MVAVRKEQERKPTRAVARPGLLGELSAEVLKNSPAASPEPARAPEPAPLAASPGPDASRPHSLVCSC